MHPIPYPTDERHAAAAMALQLWGGMDPDRSRFVGQYVVRAILRAGVRPTDGLPTNAEVIRATNALKRRAISVNYDDVYAALFDALCEGVEPDYDELPIRVDSTCGICRLEGPDSDGNYDLIPDPRCPVH